MSSKIQKPTLGRGVIYTAWRGEGEASGKVDEYTGLVVGVAKAHEGTIDIKTFGPNSIYSNNGVHFDANGKAGTWRYPERCDDMLDVNDAGEVVLFD